MNIGGSVVDSVGSVVVDVAIVVDVVVVLLALAELLAVDVASYPWCFYTPGITLYMCVE